MKQDLLKGLTEEQISKVQACKNQEDLLTLAKQEGIQLTDEHLEAVNGGMCSTKKCPKCGSDDYMKEEKYVGPGGGVTNVSYRCNKCGNRWA